MRSSVRIASHPVHPMLIQFPTALWTTSFIMNVLGGLWDNYALHQTAYYVLVAGCLGAVVAAVPGVIDLFGAIPKGSAARRTGYQHGVLNVLALVLWVVSLYARQGGGGMTMTAYVTAAVAMLVLSVAVWLGGTLVYDHHVGVPGVDEPAGRA